MNWRKLIQTNTTLSTCLVVVLASSALLCSDAWAQAPTGAVPVHVSKINNRFVLIRNGEPYYIQGAGGKKNFDQLAASGGNSIRTWGAENAQQVLDEAYRLGLTVTLGLWVGHERHGFDYNDDSAVARQLEKFQKIVTKFQNHPALLMWGIGNEVNLNYTNTKVWDAIDDIAAMIDAIDGVHPTMTVLAGAPQRDIQLIVDRCPHIEVLGINSYLGLSQVPNQLRNFGWEGPYVVTEWGPNGYWEVATTEWGAAIEQSSTEKAQTYKDRYEEIILEDGERILGSYVFLWGNKQEATPTWFGLYLENGKATAAVDTMHYLWTGDWPANRAPKVTELFIDGNQSNPHRLYLDRDVSYQAMASLLDPDGDGLTLKWEVRREGVSANRAKDRTKIVATHEDSSLGEDSVFQFTAPANSGAYRLYLYAYDTHNHAATINVPFYVN